MVEKDTFSAKYKVGDIVRLGKYCLWNDTEEEDIEWVVWDVRDREVLLVSRYGLNYIPYHAGWISNITWEHCTLRKWLNNDFLDMAFSKSEKREFWQ